jgi:flagellar FliJ protein
MSSYRFRLATVLRVRRIAERSARAELALGVKRLAEAEQRYDAVVGWCRAHPAPLGSTILGDFLAERRATETAGLALSMRRKEVETARERLTESTESWRRARSAVRVLERLEERRAAEYQATMARRDAARLDELATLRWLRLAEEHYAVGGAALDARRAGMAGEERFHPWRVDGIEGRTA